MPPERPYAAARPDRSPLYRKPGGRGRRGSPVFGLLALQLQMPAQPHQLTPRLAVPVARQVVKDLRDAQ